MTRIITVFVLIMLCSNPSWSQEFYSEISPVEFVSYSNDNSSLQNVVEGLALKNDEEPLNEGPFLVNPDGTLVRSLKMITYEQLPEAVIATLERRYYNRGFVGTNFTLIENMQGAFYYSLDLISEQTTLFVMLYQDGRVFKAELQ